jgi:hypothetical protein
MVYIIALCTTLLHGVLSLSIIILSWSSRIIFICPLVLKSLIVGTKHSETYSHNHHKYLTPSTIKIVHINRKCFVTQNQRTKYILGINHVEKLRFLNVFFDETSPYSKHTSPYNIEMPYN